MIFIPSGRNYTKKEKKKSRKYLKKPQCSTPLGSYKSFSINSTPQDSAYRSPFETFI